MNAGNDRVQRTFPRRKRIGMRRVEREQPAAVLQREARAVGHEAGSEVGEVALDERDHVAGSIDDAQIGGVAAVRGQRARRDFGIGVARIDLARRAARAYAFDSIASTGTSWNAGSQTCRCHVGIGELLRLDQRVKRLGRVVAVRADRECSIMFSIISAAMPCPLGGSS